MRATDREILFGDTQDVRILVVDDSPSLVHTLTDILSSQGYRVESCSDGESGWGRLVAGAEGRAPMPDLLLLDLMMPGIDGLTLLRRLRADERFALLPAIVLTVQADSETRLSVLQAGANDYLSKPVQTVELLARVKALVGWRLAERHQQRRMDYLIEAGRVLLSTLNLDTVLQRVMEIVTIEMEAEGGTIWLRRSGDHLECRAAFGDRADRLLGMRLGPGEGVAGWALQNRQSTLVPNAQSDPRFCREVDEKINFHTRDLVAVPLIVRRTGLGVLETVNKKGGPFTPSDVAWLEVLAPIAAAAIANAQLFEALQHRTLELQASNEELDAFTHTVAHDLQDPLTIVVGLAEVLEGDLDTMSGAEIRRDLRRIAQTGRKVGSIVNELMLLSQVRKIDVEMNQLDMARIVAAVLDRLAYMIEESRAQITRPDNWPVALGYGPWVEEVWLNYLSNAVKYGGQPPSVELGATAQSDGMVRYWVRDNGPGLTPEEQARLFTPFARLDQVRLKGHGLGLSIVRRIVDKLGGQVGVESEVGRGTAFSFTLRGVDS